MCYYATTDYLCGDWKWGNMMLRCPRQHRIGETCGAKLVHHESVTKSATICKICEEIATKHRRLIKTSNNIARWSNEPDKFSASLEKAHREKKELEEKMTELDARRPSVATNIHSTSRSGGGVRNSSTSAAATATHLPPVTSMSTSATPGYEYTSAPAVNRRQDSGACSIPRNGGSTGGGARGVSLAPTSTSTSSPYASVPVGNYLNRNGTTRNSGSANVPVDRPGGAYTVSYARR